jgi:hypothetical protein
MAQHRITPSPKLVQQWLTEFFGDGAIIAPGELSLKIANRAAQWGADQELEALLVWLRVKRFDNLASDLLSARRPKPPSLKEQAMQALAEADLGSTEAEWSQRFDTIRRALEQLDD